MPPTSDTAPCADRSARYRAVPGNDRPGRRGLAVAAATAALIGAVGRWQRLR